VTNRVAVAGHLAGRPDLGPGQRPPEEDARAWDLSVARAGRAGALLGVGGLPPERLARVTGHADRAPAVAAPEAPRNDRLEITLLRSGRD
jgi:chemotaxis protein MotB